ncbi:MAG TPA: 1-phosphofructokinase family hexose kinase [Solirubrobacteraceae bacterium]|nr:1-phosphofructokinase family hexose kinase [Solirubrobacteraceae bacterium]
MILTVTANVAIDRTYVIDRLEVGSVHKVTRAYAHTGGKGVNVSRCLHRLGAETLVTGIIGRDGLDEVTAELNTSGLSSKLFAVDGAPRQTVTVTANDGSTTAFDEPGPALTATIWADFEQHVTGLLAQAQMVVIAGSLPPGTPEQALADLCWRAGDQQVPVILDARGAAMRAAQNQKPLVAKLNRSELAHTLGTEITSEDDVIDAALALRELGAQHVVVTLGEHGAIGVGDEVWTVRHPTVRGNPIGAGDAFSAALALALTQQRPFEQALSEGAAAALASLNTPTAGALEPGDVLEALGRVETHLTRRAGER